MSDPVIYRRDDTLFVLQDEEMRDYFASCPGGLPEAPLIDWAWENFKPTWFLDVGSHVGTWAHTFSVRGSHVLAWEPNDEIRRYWEAGNQLNDNVLSTVDSHALGSESGWSTLQAPYRDGGGGTLMFTAGRHAHPVDQTVAVDTLDNSVGTHYPWSHRQITLIKIDAEGYERFVLAGAVKTITKWQPKIIFECWEDERGQTTVGLFNFIGKTLGYTSRRVAWPDTWIAEPT